MAVASTEKLSTSYVAWRNRLMSYSNAMTLSSF